MDRNFPMMQIFAEDVKSYHKKYVLPGSEGEGE